MIQPTGCLATVLMLPWIAYRSLQARVIPAIRDPRLFRPLRRTPNRSNPIRSTEKR